MKTHLLASRFQWIHNNEYSETINLLTVSIVTLLTDCLFIVDWTMTVIRMKEMLLQKCFRLCIALKSSFVLV